MDAKDSLRFKLDLLQKVFNTKSILSIQPDKNYIQKYYKANKLAYSLFHTYSDQVHMGVSRDGVYKENDLLEGARIVEIYIPKLKTRNILELASGRGATAAYLAQKYPKIKFTGIELSQGQLSFAVKKAKKLLNYHPSLGDYHDLSHFADASFEIVFVIEALCHSQDKFRVLSEVKRVLKKGGVFIILDGYTGKDRTAMTKQELDAVRLTEKGMAVNEFESFESLVKKARKQSFKVDSDEDVSKLIMPTLERFERLAFKFFKRPKAAKLITKIASKEVTYNAVSGLLMPNLIKQGLASYHITVLKK
jgi:ubiquinone/menaquinone biosynthesis C-methylase UbiE